MHSENQIQLASDMSGSANGGFTQPHLSILETLEQANELAGQLRDLSATSLKLVRELEKLVVAGTPPR